MSRTSRTWLTSKLRKLTMIFFQQATNHGTGATFHTTFSSTKSSTSSRSRWWVTRTFWRTRLSSAAPTRATGPITNPEARLRWRFCQRKPTRGMETIQEMELQLRPCQETVRETSNQPRVAKVSWIEFLRIWLGQRALRTSQFQCLTNSTPHWRPLQSHHSSTSTSQLKQIQSKLWSSSSNNEPTKSARL